MRAARVPPNRPLLPEGHSDLSERIQSSDLVSIWGSMARDLDGWAATPQISGWSRASREGSSRAALLWLLGRQMGGRYHPRRRDGRDDAGRQSLAGYYWPSDQRRGAGGRAFPPREPRPPGTDGDH